MKQFLTTVVAMLMTTQIYADQKNLAIESLDISTNDYQNTADVLIEMQNDQYVSITERYDSKVEVRFYVKKSSERSYRRIMSSKRYFFPSESVSYTLSPREACTSTGSYKAKVEISVRHDEYGYPYNDRYKTYEGTGSYYCSKSGDDSDDDHDYRQELRLDTDTTLYDSDSDGYDDQITTVFEARDSQWEDISEKDGYIAVKFYVTHKGRTYTVNQRAYKMNSQKASLTINKDTVCSVIEIEDIWDLLIGWVTVSNTAEAVNENGKKDSRFEKFEGRDTTIYCGLLN